MFHDMIVRSEHFGTLHFYCAKHKEFKMNAYVCQTKRTTICFTICLFISPDLDGHRAPKMKYYGLTNTSEHFTFTVPSTRNSK